MYGDILSPEALDQKTREDATRYASSPEMEPAYRLGVYSAAYSQLHAAYLDALARVPFPPLPRECDDCGRNPCGCRAAEEAAERRRGP